MPNELVVFLHGLGQTPQSWQDQVTDLPPDLPAAAPWLRGLRPGSGNRFSLRDAAAEIGSVLTMHGAGRAYLVGLSIGAMVALQTALDDARVAGLVLAAAQVDPPRWMMKAQGLMLRAASRRRLADRGLDKDAMSRVFRALGEADLSERLGDVGVPTLVLCGDRDKANQPACRRIAARVPGARLEIMTGGHQLNLDNPKRFNELTFGFLAGLRDETPT